MTKRKNISSIIFYILFFIFFSIIMLLSPHSVDDTYYDYLNMTDFFDILHFSAGYGNGRVLGNLFAVYLCKSSITSAIVRGLTVTLIIYFITKITTDNDSQKKITASIVGVALIGIGAIFFGEVYAWISAFTNYSLPILAVLICIDQIKSYNKLSISKLTLVFLFGFSSQLFSENSSLNNFILACSVLIFCLFKNKAKIAIAFDFAASTALGVAAMVLCRLFCNDDRSFYSSSVYSNNINLKSIINAVIDNSIKYTQWLSVCKILLILLSSALIITVSKSRIKNNLKLLTGLGLILYPAYSCFYSISINNSNYFEKLYYIPFLISAALIAIYFVAVIYSGFLLNSKYKGKFLFAIIFAMLTAVYLLVLSPINSRCLFYTYCVMLIAVLISGKAAFEQININIKSVQCAAYGVIAVIFAFLIPIYASITLMDNKVNNYVQNQIEPGNTTVAVCRVTNTDYFHHSYYSSRLGWIYYKNEPKDIEFEEVSIDDWLKNYCQNY